MPIYEYHCRDCEAEFELIRSFNDADKNLHCISCEGNNIRRKLSLCNASSGGKSISGNSGCSSCSSSNCSTCGGH